MNTALTRESAWSVVPAAAIIGLIVISTWPHSFIGVFSDSISYIRIATFLSPFAAADELVREVFLTTHFPPGYPFVLGLLGGTASNLTWAFAIHCLIFAATVVVVAMFFRDEFSDRRFAIGATLLTVLSPAWLMAAMRFSSEPLFACLLLAGLMLASRERFRLAGLTFGLACLVRSIGVTVLPAFVLWLVIDPSRRKGAMLPIALAILPYVAWEVFRTLTASGTDYASDLSVVLGALSGGAAIEYVIQQGSAVISALSLALDQGPLALLAGGALIVFLIPGWFSRFRAGKLDAYILPCYLALIAIWPYPWDMPRFLGPVTPLVLLSAASALDAVPQARAAIAAVFSGWVALLAGGMIFRLAVPVPEGLAAYKVSDPYYGAANHVQAVELLETIRSFDTALENVPMVVPAEACVYSTVPEIAGFLAERRFVTPETDVESGASTAENFPQCEFFFVSLIGPAQGLPPYYPYSEVETATQQIFITTFPQGGNTALGAALLVKAEEPGTSLR